MDVYLTSMGGWLQGLTAHLAAETGGSEAVATYLAEHGGLSANQQALLLVVLIGLALLVPAALLGISWFCHKHTTSNPTKDEPFESGIACTIGSASERFSIKFYLIAMLFLVFDLEVAFLYPWVVRFADGGWFMFGVLLVFLVMLEAGYLYLYRKGALDWDD